ncbi:MAG: PilZ domain-containing protein [Geminicoccaceae bacterium]
MMSLPLPRPLRRLIQHRMASPEDKRRFQRAPTRILASLILLDRMQTIDGLILNLSAGGLLFRPARSYLLDRRDEPVRVVADDIHLNGTIAGTSPRGYGVRFHQPTSDRTIDDLLTRSETPPQLPEWQKS